MYESFYGLKEKPFSMLPDPGFLYLSKKHQKALTLFEYGLMNHAGFCVISGEIGSGKTTIMRKLLENMSRKIRVGMITNTHKGFGNLLDWVLSAYSIHEKGLTEVEKHQRFVDFLIEQYAAKKTTLLIVDEAQNMAADKLEELRMLSNINSDKNQVLQIILAGQPELKETLSLPELKQFVQRIAVDYHLDSLDQEDTRGYIAHRLSVAGADRMLFTEEACDLIYKYSGGSPRLINLLCDTVMVYGFADQLEVIDDVVVIDMILERMQSSMVPLACTDLPERKVRKQVADKSMARESASEQSATSGITKQSSVDAAGAESDFGEKVLQAAASEKIEASEVGTEVVSEEEIQSCDTLGPVEDKAHTAPEKIESVIDSSDVTKPAESKRQRLLIPILMSMLVLVIATLFFALSLDDDGASTGAATSDINKYSTPPEPINRTTEILQQDVVDVVPDAIQKQLDEAQKLQQEMVLRQKEDSDRLKNLEEQAVLLKKERDKALVKAKAEKEKRESEARAARISAEREKAAEKIAQQAVAEAMAADQKAKALEELRAREQQDIADALEAEQKKLEAEKMKAEAEKMKAEAEKAPTDVRCEGATARFLSTCR
ncbi:MAG: AAA family ATPase [Gammaproteobacteria bacterium]|nr:AAA family ATPase [Gammaproteobacteria bacterium]